MLIVANVVGGVKIPTGVWSIAVFAAITIVPAAGRSCLIKRRRGNEHELYMVYKE